MKRFLIIFFILCIFFSLSSALKFQKVDVEYSQNGSKITSIIIFQKTPGITNWLQVLLASEFTTDLDLLTYVGVIYLSEIPLPCNFADSKIKLTLGGQNEPIEYISIQSDSSEGVITYQISMEDLYKMSKHSAGEFIVTGGNTKKVLSFTYNPAHVKKFMAAILPDYLYVLHHKLSRVLPTSEDSPETP